MNLIPKNFYLDDFFENVGTQNNTMKCDIYEKNGDYNIEVEIPGFDKNNVKIEVDKGYLTITAEREFVEEQEEKKYVRKERSYGKYQRSFYLGDNIDVDKVKAEFKNGILKILVPKLEEIETKKQIEIEE